MIEISGNVAVLNNNPNRGRPPDLEGRQRPKNYQIEGGAAALRSRSAAELAPRQRTRQYSDGAARVRSESERSQIKKETAGRQAYKRYRILINRLFLGTLVVSTAVFGWEILGPPAATEETTGTDGRGRPGTAHEDIYQGEIPSETAYQEILNQTPTITAEVGEEQADRTTAATAELAEGETEQRRQENYQALRQLAVERWIATEGDDLEAYVPLHDGSPAAGDGITGPYGYNFAGRTETMLQRDGFSEQEIANFLPWTELYGQEALDYITMNPYTFSARQKELMKESNVKMILDDGLEKYREEGLELLDLDWRIAAATLQTRGLFGANLDFSDYQGEDNVYGDLAQYEKDLESQNWLAAVSNYANVIKRYWQTGGRFNEGWGNRFNAYFENDLLPAVIEAHPELESRLLAVANELNEIKNS